MVAQVEKLALTWILSHRDKNPAQRARLIKSLGDLIKLVGVKPVRFHASFCANLSDDRIFLLQILGLIIGLSQIALAVSLWYSIKG